jgi:carboxyl-terminal processing protease
MPKFALLLCLLALPATPQAPPQPQNVWLASFDQVWQTIKDRHWDLERKGASWDAARAELRPLIEKGASGDEARAILNQLLARLGQSHFGIIPASTYAALQSGKTPGDAEPGFDVRIVDGLPLVTRVLPDSPAAPSPL